MISPDRKEQKRLVLQWETTGRELERIRREALHGMSYNWKDVDALLELGDLGTCVSRHTSGLIEMQRWFMKAVSHRRS